MLWKNEKWRRLLVVSIILTLPAPIIAQGAGDTGRDWYCSDPKAHTSDYKKHLKLHIDHEADRIAAKLNNIYTNQTFTSKEKQAKTVEILNRYLLQAKVGMGD